VAISLVIVLRSRIAVAQTPPAHHLPPAAFPTAPAPPLAKESSLDNGNLEDTLPAARDLFPAAYENLEATLLERLRNSDFADFEGDFALLPGQLLVILLEEVDPDEPTPWANPKQPVADEVLENLATFDTGFTTPDEVAAVSIAATYPITLAQALAIARRRSNELQTAQLVVERAAAQLRATEADLYPEIDLGTEGTYAGRSNVTRTRDDTVSEIEQTSEDQLTGTVRLGARVEYSYDLLGGTLQPRLDQNRIRLQQSELTLQQVTNNITRDVALGYYDLQRSLSGI